MTSRIGTRRTARAAAVFLSAAAAILALAAPALGQDTPPGWPGPTSDPNAWIAYTVSPTLIPTVGRGGKWGPVVLTRHSSLTGAAAVDLLSNWDTSADLDGDGIPDAAWPAVWSAGGLTLAKDETCPATSDSCHYFVTAGGGGNFFVAAGTPALGPDGVTPTQDLGAFQQTISLAPEKNLTIVFGWDPTSPATRTPASGATHGRLTLDASGTHDDLSGILTYQWTVTRLSDHHAFTSSPNPTAQFDLDTDGVYCVALTVTNSQDPANPKTYGVTTQDCKDVTQVAPQAPANAPGSGGGVPAAGGGSGGGNVPTIVFAKPRTVRATSLTGTGKSAGSDVIWLWRPDFYQPSSDTQTLPATSGRPVLKGHQDIVVRSTPAPDQNAGPWLAGLGIFGVIGFGWLFNKRRQVRRAEY